MKWSALKSWIVYMAITERWSKGWGYSHDEEVGSKEWGYGHEDREREQGVELWP